MALPRVKNVPYLVLGILVFVVVSQVADLAAGAAEVGVRVTVLVVAALGAAATGGWILRQRRLAPAPAPRPDPIPEWVPDDPDTA